MTHASEQDQLKLEAIDMLAQLASTEPDELTLRRAHSWRNQSEQHAIAWQQAEQAWAAMAEIPKPAVLRAAANDALGKQGQSKHRYLAWLSGGMAASLLIFSLAGYFTQPSQMSSTPLVSKVDRVQTHSYRNDSFTARTVLLEDGSVAHLNVNTLLTTSFSAHARQVELVRGEALFEVKSNAERPFIVHSGITQAKAIGTAFVVKQHENRVHVTVTEGVVQVSIDADKNDTAQVKQFVKLVADQSVTSAGNTIGQAKQVNSQDIAAWQQGMLVFRDTPLHLAIEEINRYTPYQIQAKLGNRQQEPITGSFFINNISGQLSALLVSLNLRVISQQKGKLEIGLMPPGVTHTQDM